MLRKQVGFVQGGGARGAIPLHLSAVGSLRIGQRLQAQRRRVRKAQHHRLAPRRHQPVLGRLADDRRAEGIRYDQAGVGRKYLARHIDDRGEEQPVQCKR